MKILYLCPDLGIPVLGRKGASVHVRSLIAALGRAGHKVVLAAQTLNKSPWDKPAEVGWPILQVRPSSAATAAVAALKEFNQQLGIESSLAGELRRILFNKELGAELLRRFEADPPDFIYERASLYATAGVGLAREFKVPLILELNAPLAVEQSTYRSTGLGELAGQAERWTLSQADAVLAVSAALREHVLSFSIEPARVHVLPNAIDPTLFHPAERDLPARARLNLNDGPVIGFVGGLRAWHGVEVLPALLERLVERHPEVRLVIVGDGPLRDELKGILDQRGLSTRVLITGLVPHEEIPRMIRQFDVAVAPYSQLDHPFYFSPLKLFEYLGCGIPVVAPELGQIAEVLTDQKTGLLYAPGNLDGLTACCDRLLTDSALRQRLGQAGAKLVHERFTWDHNARFIVELAASLVTPRSSSQPDPSAASSTAASQ